MIDSIWCSLLLLHTVCSNVAGSIHTGLSLVQLRSEKLGSGTGVHSEENEGIQSTKPHIVIVLLDDLGWNNVGYHNESIKTPFMNEFARDGVILDRYYSSPLCAPSRFSLLTGRSAWQSEAFGSGNMNNGLPVGTSPKYTMLPAALRAVGYKTHLVGKWHQGYHEAAYLPTNRGFDSFFGINTGETNHFTQQVWGTCDFMQVDLMRDEAPSVVDDDQVLGDDRYRERAVQLIQSHDKSKPLFLYLSLQMPHSPFQVTDKYSSMYSFQSKIRNVYYGMISHADDTLKAVVDALKQEAMYDKSIVVVMSDNGATLSVSTGTDGHTATLDVYSDARRLEVSETVDDGNFPLKAGKGSVYEGGIRVPAFVNGGYLTDSARGQIREGLVSVSDWYATLADLAGAQKPDSVLVDSSSINMWPYITGKASVSPRERVVQMSLIFSSHQMSVALISGTWKMVLGTGECKRSAPCLFDLKNDPYEKSDVSGLHESTASSMNKDIEDLIESAMESAWFGWLPKDGISAEAAYFQSKRCKASQAAKGYFVPWASSADEEHLYKEGQKSIKLLKIL